MQLDGTLVSLHGYLNQLEIPTRPATATTCEHCGGEGKLALTKEPGLENVVCYCGGLGWLP